MAITTTREDGRRLYIPTSKLMIDITVNLSRYAGDCHPSVYCPWSGAALHGAGTVLPVERDPYCHFCGVVLPFLTVFRMVKQERQLLGQRVVPH